MVDCKIEQEQKIHQLSKPQASQNQVQLIKLLHSTTRELSGDQTVIKRRYQNYPCCSHLSLLLFQQYISVIRPILYHHRRQ
jgi:hypothetical protein